MEPMTGIEPAYSAWEEDSTRLWRVAEVRPVSPSAETVQERLYAYGADCTSCDTAVTPNVDVQRIENRTRVLPSAVPHMWMGVGAACEFNNEAEACA